MTAILPPDTMTRPRCTICRQRCVPLADFDEPVCLYCEQTRNAAIAAEQRRTGPAPRAVIDELVDALFPTDRASVRRLSHRRLEPA